MSTLSHHKIHSMSHFRGALWGMLAGAPIGLATSLNIPTESASQIITMIVCFWIAGGLCGHNMQMLLEGKR